MYNPSYVILIIWEKWTRKMICSFRLYWYSSDLCGEKKLRHGSPIFPPWRWTVRWVRNSFFLIVSLQCWLIDSFVSAQQNDSVEQHPHFRQSVWRWVTILAIATAGRLPQSGTYSNVPWADKDVNLYLSIDCGHYGHFSRNCTTHGMGLSFLQVNTAQVHTSAICNHCNDW